MLTKRSLYDEAMRLEDECAKLREEHTQRGGLAFAILWELELEACRVMDDSGELRSDEASLGKRATLRSRLAKAREIYGIIRTHLGV